MSKTLFGLPGKIGEDLFGIRLIEVDQEAMPRMLEFHELPKSVLAALGWDLVRDPSYSPLTHELQAYQEESIRATADYLGVDVRYPHSTYFDPSLPSYILGETRFGRDGRVEIAYNPSILGLPKHLREGVIAHEVGHLETPGTVELGYVHAFYSDGLNYHHVPLGTAIIEGGNQLLVKSRTGNMPPAYEREVEFVEELNEALSYLPANARAHSAMALFYLAQEDPRAVAQVLNRPEVSPIVNNYCMNYVSQLYSGPRIFSQN